MILVTGCGRSGTSAVAQILHNSGISVGRDLIPPDEGNAEGYFEERAIVEMNDRILLAAGIQHWFAEPSRAEIIAAAEPHLDTMRELAAEATPAWKDPRFSWTLEAWNSVLSEPPRLIVCLRSPGEVVASTLRYYGLDGEEATRAAQHVWRAEYERLLAIIASLRLEATCVEYAALQSSPAKSVARLERFVGRPLVADTLRPSLKHHNAAVAPEFGELYARVKALGAAPARRRVRGARAG